MLAYVFQARLELVCTTGFQPRHDLSGYTSDDSDRASPICTIATFANGPSAAMRPPAGISAEEDTGKVTRVWTDPLPLAEVERVAPNEDDATSHAT